MSDAKQLLTDDHQELDQLLETLHNALSAPHPDEVHATLDLFWARLAMHIRAEHLHLFPAVIDAQEEPSVRIQTVVVKLREDHDFFMKALSQAVKLSRAQNNSENLTEIRSLISIVTLRLQEHNQIEEATIYPLVQALLTASGNSLLAEQLQHELQSLPPRFQQ